MEQIPLMDFRGDEFLRLTIDDRIRQCRAFAEEAKYHAALAAPNQGGDYLDPRAALVGPRG